MFHIEILIVGLRLFNLYYLFRSHTVEEANMLTFNFLFTNTQQHEHLFGVKFLPS